jgi:hypothetical protein
MFPSSRRYVFLFMDVLHTCLLAGAVEYRGSRNCERRSCGRRCIWLTDPIQLSLEWYTLRSGRVFPFELHVPELPPQQIHLQPNVCQAWRWCGEADRNSAPPFTRYAYCDPESDPSNRSPMRIGLAAQGIDPTTGTPVGNYVVCESLISAPPDFSNRGNVELGRRIGQLLRISHQVRTPDQHGRPSLDARMGSCGRHLHQGALLCKPRPRYLDYRALTVCRGLELATGFTWPICIGEEPNGSSAHTWPVSTLETSSLWVSSCTLFFHVKLTVH